MPVSSINSSNNSSTARENSDVVQRQARDQIVAAEKAVTNAQQEAESTINQIKDKYEKQELNELSREEASLDAQRNKGYQQLRDLKRTQQEEISRVRKDGENERSRLGNYYRDSIYNQESDGRKALDDLKSTDAARVDYERKTGNDLVDDVKSKNTIQLNQQIQNSEIKRNELEESSRRDLESRKLNYQIENEKNQELFEQKHQTITSEHDQILERLNASSTSKLHEIRRDTSEKLAAYEARQKDPFYKLMSFQSDLQETGDAFVLTAKIPAHEQKHLNVSVSGNHLILSGYRSNQEKLEVEPGRTQGSASYQTFFEKFPLNWPVDAQRLSREYTNTEVIIRVPKKSDTYQRPTAAAPVLERGRFNAPAFPENLPQIDPNLGQLQPDSAPRVSVPHPGSGTLS